MRLARHSARAARARTPRFRGGGCGGGCSYTRLNGRENSREGGGGARRKNLPDRGIVRVRARVLAAHRPPEHAARRGVPDTARVQWAWRRAALGQQLRECLREPHPKRDLVDDLPPEMRPAVRLGPQDAALVASVQSTRGPASGPT